jgi:hypothetical protein
MFFMSYNSYQVYIEDNNTIIWVHKQITCRRTEFDFSTSQIHNLADLHNWHNISWILISSQVFTESTIVLYRSNMIPREL